MITHENLDRLRDCLTDVKNRRLVAKQRFYYYGEQHRLGNSMRKEIDEVKRLLGGEVIHSNFMNFE